MDIFFLSLASNIDDLLQVRSNVVLYFERKPSVYRLKVGRWNPQKKINFASHIVKLMLLPKVVVVQIIEKHLLRTKLFKFLYLFPLFLSFSDRVQYLHSREIEEGSKNVINIQDQGKWNSLIIQQCSSPLHVYIRFWLDE